MTLALRPYQAEGLASLRRALRVHRRVLFQLPTGGGKTVIAATMLGGAAAQGKRAWFVVHRRELVEQTAATLDKVGVEYGYIAAGFAPRYRMPVTLCSVQTLAARLRRADFPAEAPDLIVWDECVAGDSLVETDKGLIAIRDVPASGASLIKSAEGECVVWRKITAWRETEPRAVLSLNLSDGRQLRGTPNHLIRVMQGWKPIGEITPGDLVLSSPIESAGASSGHSSATHPFRCRTDVQSLPALRGRTRPSRPNGSRTRPRSFIGSTRNCASQKTKGTGRRVFAAQLPASMRLRKLWTLSGRMAVQRQSRRIGSINWGRKVSRGGIATTVPMSTVLAGVNSTRKAMANSKTKLSEHGWRAAMEMRGNTLILGASFTCDLPGNLHSAFSPKSSATSPCVCATSWVRVDSVNSSEPEPVYDISVDGTECFFANGILSHNCHHAAAGTWKFVAEHYPNALHVGLTATPERLDGKGLNTMFRALVPGPSIRWLIEQGFLSPFRVWTKPAPDVSGVKLKGADFDAARLGEIMSEPAIMGDAVQHYLDICPGRQAVAFCCSIDHANAMRDAFRARGVTAEELDGTARMDHRRNTVRAFRRGEISVLTSVDLFGEGFDLPELAAAILLRPTQSLGLYMQQVGRALRAAPGKDCAYILDHAGNVARHGLPDEEREWSLAGRKRRRVNGQAPAKVCDNCFGSCAPACVTCPHCGHPFDVDPRQVPQVDGELREIDLNDLRAAAARANSRPEFQGVIARARTLEELRAIAKVRGYHWKWADHIWRARLQQGRGQGHAG